jgi:hypothetical protein
MINASIPTGAVSCTCGGSICRGDRGGTRRYTCRRCKRFVPYCFGATDGSGSERDLWCDDCWALTEES